MAGGRKVKIISSWLVLDQCCFCCCSLRTGVLIIASLEILFLVAVCIDFGMFLYVSAGEGSARLLEWLVASTLETIVHCGFTCLLIHGVRKNRPQLVWAWVWTRGVVMLTDFCTLFIGAFVFVEKALLPVSVASVILCYNILVVRSYALKMKEGEDPATSDVTSLHRFERMVEEV
ncbi:uncharacterized protein [Panulirus ornatus]|uniref:uncharacterized protein isoform X2 n=1 Tax=Panulirus ornatus TaxID=150431 RepID=UPI003A8BE01C